MRKEAGLLFVLVICFSCSIQKRHHTGGYYIQWHKRYHQDEGKREKEQPGDTLVEITTIDTTVVSADTITTPAGNDTEVAGEKVSKHKKLADLPREQRKFEPLGVLAFKILALDIPIGIAHENTGEHKLLVQFGIAFLVVLVISFVLGIVSMIRYLRNPRHYKFNIFGLIAVLIPLFYFVEILLGNYDII